MTTSYLRRPFVLRNLSLAAGSVLLSAAAFAQAPVLIASASDVPVVLSSSSLLPDAPGVVTAERTSRPGPGFGGQEGALSTAPSAGNYAMVIQPGQTAPRQSKRTEVISGLKDSFSPLAVIGWAASAGYEQATDGSPNYGQTGKGFAQRFGASAARATSENVFTESILAPVLHEDPRYYRMGKGHNFVKRLAYAGTRELITRTDGGHRTINIANIGGNLAGSALTQAYYPELNRGFNQVAQTFGGSVGGSALGYVVAEFLPDIFHHHN